MPLRYCILTGLLLCPAAAWSQSIDFSFLTTRAEATQYQETTRYEEVVAFTEIVANASEQLFKTNFGYSSEGRALPLIVFGDLEGADPASVRASGKLRVFVQANIHAGEVCGKEAMLMLLRALAAGQHAAWADSLVLLVAPIYNADGNERVQLTNRPAQNGPVGGMGQRPNAQGYDLNRDHMKLGSPEARSLVRLMNDYDPHVLIDLHTTNGSYHAYHLTYSPPLHPNTPVAIDSFLRERLLPEVTDRIKKQYGWDYYYYGNLPPRRMEVERAWYTFDHRPRFNNNYVGLRNRFAILSEAYSYASFEERVLATLYFVEEILDVAYEQASQIRRIVEQADVTSVVGSALAVQAEMQRSEKPVDILLGDVARTTHPLTGEVVLERLDVSTPESMYEYGRFKPTVSEVVPQMYVVPQDQAQVLDRIRAHGLHVRVLQADSVVAVERFRIDSLQLAEREYQGHYSMTLSGAYESSQQTLPAGSLLVPLSQPLGRLAFSLIEPMSDDGLLSWGLVGSVEEGGYYPIMRIGAP